jgi:aspartyl-tRNA(Asn)/glutamyl-tRNA(Gln) amidotransferase subunit C
MTVTLSLEEVEKIAHLARLALTADEKTAYAHQLSAVLDYVAQIGALDLDEVPPTTHAVTRHNVWRDDLVQPSLPLEDVLYNAPDQAADQFRIQAILEE